MQVSAFIKNNFEQLRKKNKKRNVESIHVHS